MKIQHDYPQFRNCFKKSLVGLKIVIMMSWGFI